MGAACDGLTALTTEVAAWRADQASSAQKDSVSLDAVPNRGPRGEARGPRVGQRGAAPDRAAGLPLRPPVKLL